MSQDIKPQETVSAKKKKGQTTKELTEIHLKDKTHIITDEEIKDLTLDFNNPDLSTSHTPVIANDSDRPKDEDKDPKIATPWDVISE